MTCGTTGDAGAYRERLAEDLGGPAPSQGAARGPGGDPVTISDFAIGLAAACALLGCLGWLADQLERPRPDSTNRRDARRRGRQAR